jgi:RimJ/RimL family protein N-acetyltransferase
MIDARANLGLDQPLVADGFELDRRRDEDLTAFLPFFQDEKLLWRYLPDTFRTFEHFELVTLFEEWDDGRSNLILVIRMNDIAVGLLTIDNIDFANRNAELGIAITDPTKRRRGLAHKAFNLLLNHLLDPARLHRVYVRVVEGNEASLALFKKLGFEREGVMRDALRRGDDYLDMMLLSRLGT